MSELLTGNLLVASSLVNDPNYANGVCLIMHQDEEHTIGVMLNRPLQPTPEALRAILGPDHGANKPATGNRLVATDPTSPDDPFTADHVSEEAATFDDSFDVDHAEADGGGERTRISEMPSPWRMVHVGGPLSGPVVALHQDSELAEAEPGVGIYIAAEKQHLEDLVREPVAPYRLIVGHLGWKSEDLQNEIDGGVWHVIPATADRVFLPAREMWPHLIRRATSNSLAKWLGVPDNAYANELN